VDRKAITVGIRERISRYQSSIIIPLSLSDFEDVCGCLALSEFGEIVAAACEFEK